MNCPPVSSSLPKQPRRWYQYRLRTLFAVTAVFAVGLSYFASRMQKATQQAAAVSAIKAIGGDVGYDYQVPGPPAVSWDTWVPLWYSDAPPPGPAWLRSVLGDDFFRSVVQVCIATDDFTDAECQHLVHMPDLQELIAEGTPAGDTGMKAIGMVRELRYLELSRTNVTSSGVASLAGLKRLECLYLVRTKIDDTALRYLQNLTQLRLLYLDDTNITDAGLELDPEI